ncbi:aldo/keto reductase [Paenibacillus hodogayensis]|uniref:Aldo/keto reductase n=1 Tax=Paenibacillus hodogayensis TaxID=279208 RepID=A0ABV5VTV9_9BACL
MVTTAAPLRGPGSLKLSRLMLGTAQLGITGYGIANGSGPADADALLDRCAALGINCFDTALEYGDAELKLGRYFASKPVPFIVSKLKAEPLLDRAELEKRIAGRVETILERLGLSTLPALMIHDPAVLLEYGASVADILRRLRRDGLIGRAGLSFGANSDEQFAYCGELIRDDIYEVFQLPLNVLDRRSIDGGALGQLRADGKWVVARSVFLQGLLLRSADGLAEPLAGLARDALARLTAIADEEGMSVAELAMGYVRDTPGVDALVIGAEKPEQLDDNVRLLAGPAVSERARARIESEFRRVPELLVTPALWVRANATNL